MAGVKKLGSDDDWLEVLLDAPLNDLLHAKVHLLSYVGCVGLVTSACFLYATYVRYTEERRG
jgi:hypothetical protein